MSFSGYSLLTLCHILVILCRFMSLSGGISPVFLSLGKLALFSGDSLTDLYHFLHSSSVLVLGELVLLFRNSFSVLSVLLSLGELASFSEDSLANLYHSLTFFWSFSW
ncbi:hypothetical protein C2G38_2201698 [Gigaspora rosea]|uniref:Uncharacterized protein n=1 Tax=Gigaspora rosea TaxID=44941 RepID=A0A397UR39_9GLOM|nr:hypothetical protein C2G38_2201698 [Gigaspora rosea]